MQTMHTHRDKKRDVQKELQLREYTPGYYINRDVVRYLQEGK